MSGLRPLSKVVPKAAGQVFGRKYIMLGRLVTCWPEIVGEDLANRVRPLRLRRRKSKSGGQECILDIAASGANATLLHYRTGLILEKIACLFGEGLVTGIRFVPETEFESITLSKTKAMHEKPLSPDAQERLTDILESVDDPDLRERLERLGTAVIREANSK